MRVDLKLTAINDLAIIKMRFLFIFCHFVIAIFYLFDSYHNKSYKPFEKIMNKDYK
jgi:hypothetical protein